MIRFRFSPLNGLEILQELRYRAFSGHVLVGLGGGNCRVNQSPQCIGVVKGWCARTRMLEHACDPKQTIYHNALPLTSPSTKQGLGRARQSITRFGNGKVRACHLPTHPPPAPSAQYMYGTHLLVVSCIYLDKAEEGCASRPVVVVVVGEARSGGGHGVGTVWIALLWWQWQRGGGGDSGSGGGGSSGGGEGSIWPNPRMACMDGGGFIQLCTRGRSVRLRACNNRHLARRCEPYAISNHSGYQRGGGPAGSRVLFEGEVGLGGGGGGCSGSCMLGIGRPAGATVHCLGRVRLAHCGSNVPQLLLPLLLLERTGSTYACAP